MSMSTHVIGFRPPDEKWKKMKAVWDACQKAGIDVPKNVLEFFDGEDPHESGVMVELGGTLCCSKYVSDGESGYEIDLSKLPDGIKTIRFFNAW